MKIFACSLTKKSDGLFFYQRSKSGKKKKTSPSFCPGAIRGLFLSWKHTASLPKYLLNQFPSGIPCKKSVNISPDSAAQGLIFPIITPSIKHNNPL